MTLERTLVLASAHGCGFVVIIAGAGQGPARSKWGAGMIDLLVVGRLSLRPRGALDRMALIGNLGATALHPSRHPKRTSWVLR